MRNSGDILKRIGYRIRVLRDLAGYTQAELAKRAGLSRSFITRIERGTAEASISSLAQLAAALGVSMAQILGEAPISQRPEAAALRLLEGAVAATKGVAVRLAGMIALGIVAWAEGEDASVVHVPLDWINGREIESLFVLEVADQSLLASSVPAGTMLLMQSPEAVDFLDGDLLLVQDGERLLLRVWTQQGGPVDPRGEAELVDDGHFRAGDSSRILGIVLVSWRQHKP